MTRRYMNYREIASLYQSPGTDGKRFAEYASTGRVSDLEAFKRDIRREVDREVDAVYRGLLWRLLEHVSNL